MFAPSAYDWSDKRVAYDALVRDLTALIHDERDLVANASQTAAFVWHAVPNLNWAGFYFLKGNELVVGPFQGLPACTRIALDRGVCGDAASRRQSIVVADVHAFPGHIACDANSRSELVVPVITDGVLRGVFDMDAPIPSRFDDADRAGVERLVNVFAATTDWPVAATSGTGLHARS